MNYPFTKKEWKEIFSKLYKRASVDHQFYILCMRDSHTAIKLICGQEIPKTVGIRFEPQHADEILLVLPKENKERIHAFSDADFEQLAESMAQVYTFFSPSLETQAQGIDL